MTIDKIKAPSSSLKWRGKVPGIPEFGALLNLLPAAALVFDRQRNMVLYTNQLFISLSGYQLNDLFGNPIETILSIKDLAALVLPAQIESCLKCLDGSEVDVDVKMDALDSGGQWMMLCVNPHKDENLENGQRKKEIYQSLQRLTQLLQAETLSDALRMAVKATSTYLNAENVCIYQALPNEPKLQRVMFCGDEAVFPATIPSTDLIHLNTGGVWTPSKRPQSDIHRAGLAAGQIYIATTAIGQEVAWLGLIVVSDAKHLPEENILDDLNSIAAQIYSTFMHFILVTNQSIALEKLTQQANISTATMETIHEGLVILTPDLKVREINQAAEWMLGYGSAEIVGLSAENILIGAERLLAALENALKGLSSHNLLNTSLHRRNGQVFPVRIQVIPVNRENGIEAVVVVIEDASEKEQIRLRSEQLEHRALLGEVTAVFAHEVRNPINNISAGLQLLASQFPEDHAGQDTINRMQNDCQRLNHLMESVLSFSRPNELKLAPLDICAFADNLIKRWAPRFSRVHVTPFTQFGENAPKVLGDPRALEQVFTNLFNNALEAMNKNGGTLGVRIALDTTIPNNHQVTITVSDSGPGIPEEIREKIFEPFVTTNKKGTGLGLAITKNIITAHRGSIRVNSFPGGTVFLIHLPVYYGDRA